MKDDTEWSKIVQNALSICLYYLAHTHTHGFKESKVKFSLLTRFGTGSSSCRVHTLEQKSQIYFRFAVLRDIDNFLIVKHYQMVCPYRYMNCVRFTHFISPPPPQKKTLIYFLLTFLIRFPNETILQVHIHHQKNQRKIHRDFTIWVHSGG